MDADILNKDFKWSASANISFNRNKVVKLYEGQDVQGTTYNLIVANDYVNLLREGLPASTELPPQNAPLHFCQIGRAHV